MSVNKQMYDPGADIWYSKTFRDTLESHMAYLRKTNTQTISIEPLKTDIYNGDLFGFLQSLKIAPKLHWVIMRLNNMFSPRDFGPGIISLMIPETSVIESFRGSQSATATGTITM